MSVIDFHIHLGSTFYKQNPFILQLKETNPELYKRTIKDFTDDPKVLEKFLIGQGVDRAVVLPELHPLSNFEMTTEMVVEYCRNSDILIAFAHLNPNAEADPLGKLKYYINKLNCSGLKLLPSYHHFYPNEQHLYPLYEFAQKINLPIMFHIGSSTFPHTKLKYCDPFCLDEICADFPNLTVIACHGGRGFWYDTISFLLKLHKNLYVDVAGLPPKQLLDFFPDLESKSDRFIFGSDWPGIPSTIKKNIVCVQNLPVSEAVKKEILYGNAQRILERE
jgi:predicted TIM-barrel fold metal-dependent hydrolase